jgi:hypothetical protein
MALRPRIWHFGLEYGTSARNMVLRPRIWHFGLGYGTSASDMALRPRIWHFGLGYGTSALNMALRPRIWHFGLEYGTSALNMALRPDPRMPTPSNGSLAPTLKPYQIIVLLHSHTRKIILTFNNSTPPITPLICRSSEGLRSNPSNNITQTPDYCTNKRKRTHLQHI